VKRGRSGPNSAEVGEVQESVVQVDPLRRDRRGERTDHTDLRHAFDSTEPACSSMSA
jgi:hypothetical protein